MGNRTEHGSGTVVGGGSAAPSGTTALLPLNYRLAKMGNRTEHGSGTVVGGGSAAPSGTTALLPLNYRLGKMGNRTEHGSGTIDHSGSTALSGTTVVPSGTTAWVLSNCPRKTEGCSMLREGYVGAYGLCTC